MPANQTIPAASWQRLKDVLEEALSHRAPHVRAAVVQRRCAGDLLLLREAESMLAQAALLEDEPTDWIEDCADEATRTFWSEELSRVGERIGAYVVEREIGRGGMGAVYLAERADGQFEKQVAIKVLKRGTDTEEVLQRFATERRIVARLDHPNIARLLDAGTTEDGLPYFVMEFVNGVPVTQFARDAQLSIEARLKLFAKICGAVEVAHKSGSFTAT
jgi:serine/threonine-protein kinase